MGKIASINTSGFQYFDTNAVQRITIGADSGGKMQILLYDTDGTPRTLIGQNPSGGDQVVATSVVGHNVVTELNS